MTRLSDGRTAFLYQGGIGVFDGLGEVTAIPVPADIPNPPSASIGLAADDQGQYWILNSSTEGCTDDSKSRPSIWVFDGNGTVIKHIESDLFCDSHPLSVQSVGSRTFVIVHSDEDFINYEIDLTKDGDDALVERSRVPTGEAADSGYHGRYPVLQGSGTSLHYCQDLEEQGTNRPVIIELRDPDTGEVSWSREIDPTESWGKVKQLYERDGQVITHFIIQYGELNGSDGSFVVRWGESDDVPTILPIWDYAEVDSQGNTYTQVKKIDEDGSHLSHVYYDLRKYDSDGQPIGSTSSSSSGGTLNCDEYSDGYSSEDTYQVVSQCQAAWAYRCDGEDSMADIACGSLDGYGARDKCPACN